MSIKRERRRATPSCENALPVMLSPWLGAAAGVPSTAATGAGGAVSVRPASLTSLGSTSESSRRMRSHAMRVDIAAVKAVSIGCSWLTTAGG